MIINSSLINVPGNSGERLDVLAAEDRLMVGSMDHSRWNWLFEPVIEGQTMCQGDHFVVVSMADEHRNFNVVDFVETGKRKRDWSVLARKRCPGAILMQSFSESRRVTFRSLTHL